MSGNFTFFYLWETCLTMEANIMNQDQTAPKGVVRSMFILFGIETTKFYKQVREKMIISEWWEKG